MTQASAEKAAILRRLHEGRCFLLPNVWSVGGAVHCEKIGYGAIGTTSAGIAMDSAVTDGQAGRDRTLSVLGHIVRAVALPVSADLENGFADTAEGAASTIFEASLTGAAGGSLEDATNRPDDPIYPFDVAVDRVRAAVAAISRSGRDFVLTARAENFLHGRMDLADTIARLRAFEEAGADVLFAPGLPDLESIRAVRSAVSRPINVLMSDRPAAPRFCDLAAAGVNRVSIGSRLARASENAVVTEATRLYAEQCAAWARGNG